MAEELGGTQGHQSQQNFYNVEDEKDIIDDAESQDISVHFQNGVEESDNDQNATDYQVFITFQKLSEFQVILYVAFESFHPPPSKPGRTQIAFGVDDFAYLHEFIDLYAPINLLIKGSTYFHDFVKVPGLVVEHKEQELNKLFIGNANLSVSPESQKGHDQIVLLFNFVYDYCFRPRLDDWVQQYIGRNGHEEQDI